MNHSLLLFRFAIILSITMGLSVTLRAQTCNAPPADFQFSPPGNASIEDAITAGFTPQGVVLSGNELVAAFGAGGQQVGVAKCVFLGSSGEFFFRDVEIRRANNCDEEIIPNTGITNRFVLAGCMNGNDDSSFGTALVNINGTFEGFYFVIYDPDTDLYTAVRPADGGNFDGNATIFGTSSELPNPGDPYATPTATPPTSEPRNSAADAAEAPLPVELTTFTGSSNGKQVLLEWATHTEDGNAGFKIQRNAVNGEFVTIGELAGAGDSRTEINYTFTDHTAATGTNYYRLKQLDFSGAFAYSPIISVFTWLGKENSVLLFPNPTSSEFNLIASGEWKQPQVALIDAAGRIVRQWTGLDISVSTPLSMRGLPPAVYQIRIADENKVIIQRIVKQ